MKETKGSPILQRLRLAAEIWRQIENDKQPADRWLARYFYQNRKKTGSKDRRFLSETIFAAFRHKNFLEAWVEKTKAHPVLSDTEKAEAMCLFAAVREKIITREELKDFSTIGAKYYEAISGHLLPDDSLPKSKEEMLARLYSFPLWLIQRWTEKFGVAETEKLLGYFQSRPMLILRANILKISRKKLVDMFRRMGVEANPTEKSYFGLILGERRNVFDTSAFRDGWFELQDEGSQLVCQFMKVNPGENVWDVCAGGGGKSLLLAMIMENKGRVVATDIRNYKLEELKKRAKRAGVFNIFPAELERIGELKIAQKGFDKILVDVPCSGTGTLGRNPDAKWKLTEDWFKILPEEQLNILKKSAPFLKKDGRLFYATCSVEETENEKVIEKFLREAPDFEIVPCGENGETFLKLWPPNSSTDGFFLAALKKRQN